MERETVFFNELLDCSDDLWINKCKVESNKYFKPFFEYCLFRFVLVSKGIEYKNF